MATTPNIDLPTSPSGPSNLSVAFNAAMQILDMLVVLVIEDRDLDTPPTTTLGDLGKRWIVGASPAGAWSGHMNDIALCTGADVWTFFSPTAHWRGWVLDEGKWYRYSGSTWVDDSTDGAVPEAPTDGVLYGRKDASWVEIPPGGTVNSVNGVEPDEEGNVDTPAPHVLAGINDQIGTTYTLTLADVGTDVRFTNASSVTVTVPAEATVAFPVGAMIPFSQGGAGIVTAISDGTTLIHSANGASTAGLYDARVLEYLGSDEWRVW